MTFKILQAKNDSSILRSSITDYLFNVSPPTDILYITDPDTTLTDCEGTINIFVDPMIVQTLNKPKSLLSTVAEIGGLLILFKISIAMGFLHEYLFNRKMQKKQVALQGKGAQDFKYIYTFENF